MSSGRLDVVVAWSIDRLGRSVRELLEFFDLCAGHGVIIHTCKEGHLDPASPVGRLIATILAAVAQMESERKAERVKRHHEQKADAGGRQWAGRTFGYDVSYDDPDRPHRRIVAVAVNPGEADVIRDSAARVLAGQSLSSVCRDLGACGVRTVLGVTFTPDTLKIVLCAARISGRREYVGRGNGSRHRRMGRSRRMGIGRRLLLLPKATGCGRCSRPGSAPARRRPEIPAVRPAELREAGLWRADVPAGQHR